MSETQPAPGWWLASDGNWYSPETHPESQTAAVPRASHRKITLPWGHYLGGHPGHEKRIDGPITVDDDGIHQKKIREVFVVPWSEVRAVAIEGPEEAARRVTATRLLALGVFAFAAKKKADEHAYMTVTTGSGEVLFEVDKMSPFELRGKLLPFVNDLPI